MLDLELRERLLDLARDAIRFLVAHPIIGLGRFGENVDRRNVGASLGGAREQLAHVRGGRRRSRADRDQGQMAGGDFGPYR